MTINIITAPLWKVKYQDWLDYCTEVLEIEPKEWIKEWTRQQLIKEYS